MIIAVYQNNEFIGYVRRYIHNILDTTKYKKDACIYKFPIFTDIIYNLLVTNYTNYQFKLEDCLEE